MALPSALVFEVRAGGSDLNAGGFVPGGAGTDYSRQDPAQAAGTNLTVDASVNTDVLPDGYAPASADVNNTIRIPSGVAGWTPGLYQIVSIQSGKWRLDRSPAATSAAGGTWRLGGALATPGMAGGLKVAGNDIFIKAGTYVLTTGTENVSGGVVNDATGGVATTDQTFWVGYDTNRTIWNTDANRPLIQVPPGISSVNVFTSTAAGATIRNLRIDGGNRTLIQGFRVSITSQGGGSIIERCVAFNCTNSGFVGQNGEPLFLACEAYGCSGSNLPAFSSSFAVARFLWCNAHDNSTIGFNVGSNGNTFVGCISAFNSGNHGYGAVVNSVFVNCIAYGNGQDGWRLSTSGSRTNTFINCAAVANGGYGFAGFAAIDAAALLQCAGWSNTSGNLGAGLAAQAPGFLNLSGNPFVDPASGNFALNNTAGAGALLRAAGYPNPLPGGTGNFPDIGSAQHGDAGGLISLIGSPFLKVLP